MNNEYDKGDPLKGHDQISLHQLTVVLLVLLVVISLFYVGIYWCYRKIRQVCRRREDSNDLISSTLTPSNLNQIREDRDDVSAAENFLNHAAEPSENYYCTIQDENEMTSIKLGNLHQFMESRDWTLYLEQFNRITGTDNNKPETPRIPNNKYKGQSRSIFTHEHSRVHLEINTAKKELDFIDASYIEVYNNEMFIASAGPNTETVNDFVRMLWKQRVGKVVMLTNFSGAVQPKCAMYWPAEPESVNFGYITVQLVKMDVFTNYTVRKLTLSKKNGPSRSLTQFQLTTWPVTPWGLVEFHQLVAKEATDKPTVVHCSTGTGRTGIFIALHDLINQAKMADQLDFFNTVAKMRANRKLIMESWAEYKFLHCAVQAATVCLETTVRCHGIGDRLNFLETKLTTGTAMMEKEFQNICRVIEHQYIEDIGNIHDDCIYQNNSSMYHASPDIKNRFPTILTSKPHQVELESQDNIYINAVFIPSFRNSHVQILTQLPMPTTVVDFWKMVKQKKVSLCVAFHLDFNYEDERIGHYLPRDCTKPLVFPEFQIHTLLSRRGTTWEEELVTVKTTKKASLLSKSNQVIEHHVTHLSFIASKLHAKNMFRFVQQIKSYTSREAGTIIYMCRDGALFSGMVCVLMNLLDRLDDSLYINVPLVVGSIKSIQPQVISTLDQYRTLHQVLKLYAEASSNQH